jgi:sulfate permease, SulP family
LHLSSSQGKLMLVGVGQFVRDQLAKTKLLEFIGDENVFLATPQLGEALNQAVAAANVWLGRRPEGAAPDKA